MNINRLIFFPENPNNSCEVDALKTGLVENQFIKKQPYAENHFLLGDDFLSFITFLGCSPNINLEPTTNETHSYLSFISPSIEPSCLGYTATANPKCPACKKRIADWKINTWQKASSICTCDKCNIQTPYKKLNWKQECGFGRCGFEITYIYPHEAVPTDKLLSKLKDWTAIDWGYCYANN